MANKQKSARGRAFVFSLFLVLVIVCFGAAGAWYVTTGGDDVIAGVRKVVVKEKEEEKVNRDCETCPEMVPLPDGSAIGKYPITRAEFAVFAEETGFDGKGCYHRGENDWRLEHESDWQSPGFEQTDNHPVVCMSWHDATAYADWLSEKTGKLYRLPTVEESAAATAAGAEAQEYWWGNTADDICRFANSGDQSYAAQYPGDEREPRPCEDGYVYTSPVGSFEPNQYGLYDMNGNVWEWTNSCFKCDCANAVFRGGRWNDPDLNNFRLEHNWGDRVLVRSFALGFRVLRSAP